MNRRFAVLFSTPVLIAGAMVSMAFWSGPPLPLAPLGGETWLTPLWAQTIRIDPGSFADHIDLRHVDSIQLRATGGSGRVWVLDASRVMPGLLNIPDTALPRIRLARITVYEGDAPHATALVPHHVLGNVTATAQFAIAADQTTFGYRRPLHFGIVTVTPTQTYGTIAVPYEADTRDDQPRQTEMVYSVAKHGVVMSGFVGAAVIRDDDPPPAVSWRPVRAHITYGEALRFRLSLSAPVDYYVFSRLRAIRLPGLRPVRTSDIPKRWLLEYLGSIPRRRPARPGMAFRVPRASARRHEDLACRSDAAPSPAQLPQGADGQIHSPAVDRSAGRNRPCAPLSDDRQNGRPARCPNPAVRMTVGPCPHAT